MRILNKSSNLLNNMSGAGCILNNTDNNNENYKKSQYYYDEKFYYSRLANYKFKLIKIISNAPKSKRASDVFSTRYIDIFSHDKKYISTLKNDYK